MFHAPTALNLLTVLYYTETKQSLACKKKKKHTVLTYTLVKIKVKMSFK